MCIRDRLPEEARRETWKESVERYVKFISERVYELTDDNLSDELTNMIQNAILNKQVMPSMRALMTAGPALKRDHAAGYNCSYLTLDRVRAFSEALYLLMCGCGVGFSVERQVIAKLPIVPILTYGNKTIVVTDSRIGWAKALDDYLETLYIGIIPYWDVTNVRAKGSVLKTFGGRASGPEPLENLFTFLINTFTKAQERRLNSIECHDIMCKIAECVIAGGTRRSAMISLSNRSDDRMRRAKTGNWFMTHPYRSFANNSIAYTEKPPEGDFMLEWFALYESKSGERGIFNREAMRKKMKGKRKIEYDDGTPIPFGCNPCGEINLRPCQFCNLTEVILRQEDTPETIAEKVKIATILGTIQSSLTDFRYLSADWKKNCEEERLLGVSFTGIMDCPLMNHIGDPTLLWSLRDLARETNTVWAKKLDINPAAAITCIKPSGTVSQLVNSSSGIHPRWSEYYERRVRESALSPICKVLKESGIPYEHSMVNPDGELIFRFPIKSAEDAVFRKNLSALEHLALCQFYQDNWCDHKVSVTINVRDGEWVGVGAYVWVNFNNLGGVSFLPYSDHTYQQAPYEEITKEKYKELMMNMPKEINWDLLYKYEEYDHTEGARLVACTSGSCEL